MQNTVKVALAFILSFSVSANEIGTIPTDATFYHPVHSCKISDTPFRYKFRENSNNIYIEPYTGSFLLDAMCQ